MTFHCLIFPLSRRKDYYICGDLEGEGCPFPLENDLHSIEHIRISSNSLPENSINSYPNVTQLTIEHSLEASFLIDLNRMIPLQQITQLNIKNSRCSLEMIIQLINSASNLHRLEFDFSTIRDNDLKLIEQNAIFQTASLKNQIRTIHCDHRCKLFEIEFLMKLFPQMNYLKVPMQRKEITEILSNIFRKHSHRLVSLCLTRIPKTCLQEVNQFIQRKKLLDNYSLKYLNRYLYIWW